MISEKKLVRSFTTVDKAGKQYTIYMFIDERPHKKTPNLAWTKITTAYWSTRPMSRPVYLKSLGLGRFVELMPSQLIHSSTIHLTRDSRRAIKLASLI